MQKVNVNIPKTQWFKIFLVIVSIVIIVSAGVYLFQMDNLVTNTVSVVRLKNDLARGQVITESDIEKYDMYEKEYIELAGTSKQDGSGDIVIWAERQNLVNRYSSYFQRAGTYVYKDSVTKEHIRKTPYMYSLGNNELLRLDVSQDYGRIVVPGDKLKVRAVYKSNQKDMTNPDSMFDIEEVREEVLFDGIELVDMFNAKMESIVDIYYDFMSKSAKDRETMMADKTFQESITAKYYLVRVSSDDVSKYTRIMINNPVFVTTVLERNTEVLDYVEELMSALNMKTN